MSIYFDNLYTSKQELNKKYFKCLLLYNSSEDLKRSMTALQELLGAEFVKGGKESDQPYFKVPFSEETYSQINSLITSHPKVAVLIAEGFRPRYDAFVGMCQKAYQEYLDELEFARTCHAFVTQKKDIRIKDYDFPNPKCQPYLHQKALMALGLRIKKCAFFGDMGVGKTLPALHVIRHRLQRGVINKCLCVVPNTLKYKWAIGPGNETDKHIPGVKALILEGNKEERLRTILKFKHDPAISVLITGYTFWSGTAIKETIKTNSGREMKRTIGNKNDEEFRALITSDEHYNLDMFICDESHRLKNDDSSVTKNIRTWLSKVPYRILMTGTPQPNRLHDIFAQYRILNRKIFGDDFQNFFDIYFIKRSSYPEFRSIEAERALKDKIDSISLTFPAEMCIDLPQKVYDNVFIETTADYVQILNSLDVDELIRDTCNSTFDNISTDPHMMKLLTAAAGFIYDKNKVPIPFKENPKLSALTETVEDILEENKKVIIWYNFKYSAVMIREMLEKRGIEYYYIHADMTPEERIAMVYEYEQQDKIKVIITSPGLTSEGVDIITPQYACFFDMTFHYGPIAQAEARNRRHGSSELHDRIIYKRFIMNDTLDEVVLRALDTKMSYKEFLYGIREYLIKNRVKKVAVRTATY